MRVLIVEDEVRLAATLQDLLEMEGYTADICHDGESGLDNALTSIYDVILLDVMLPKMDGFTVLRRLRAEGNTTPVLMLTARGEEIDRVLGLEIGADDYIVKPFSIKELCARVRAVLRRAAPQAEPAEKHLEHGNLRVDIERHSVTKGDTPIELTAKEFDLLVMLMRNKGKVLTRDTLLDKVWGVEYFGDTRTVDVHVRYLRQKVEDVPDSPTLIQTVRGVGYKFTDEE